MNKIYISIVIASLGLFGCAGDQTAEIQRLTAEVAALRAQTSPLPASLDNLFPPKSEAPVWILHMHSMSTPLMETFIRLQEGDMDQASATFAEFKNAFLATSTLVPEWTPRFDTSAVGSVERAFATSNPDTIFAALGALTNVCHSCHLDNMVRVQQRYNWPQFADVSVSDGDRGEVPFKQVMQEVEMGMVGVGLGLKDGSSDKAMKSVQAFKKSFSLLQDACENCHESERTYFVDASVETLIGRLEKAVSANPPDGAAAGKLLLSIGEESCFKCHLVHMPAALEQTRTALAAEGMSSH